MKILVLLALVTLFLISGIFVAVPKSQGQKDLKNEATIVLKGQITPKGREYSKEFRRVYDRQESRKLTEMSEAARLRGDIREVGFAINVATVPTVGPEHVDSGETFLREIACEARLVVVGTVANKASYLTDDETFIYTSYDFIVEEIVKNSSESSIKVADKIEVTRPGGLISVDGQLIRVEDRAYETLQSEGKYLLYLNYLPEAQGYLVASPRGDFEIRPDGFRSLTKLGALPKPIASFDGHALLAEVYNSVSVVCPPK